MFPRLAAAVDELEIPTEGDALVEILALSDRLAARINEAIGRFDASGEWEIEGAASMTGWLRHRARMSERAAANAAGTARRLRSLPLTADAWEGGSLSGGQVQAIVANVTDRHLELFVQHESGVLPSLVDLSVGQTARAMQRWRQRASALIEPDGESVLRDRSVHLSHTLDGRWEGSLSLDSEGGELVSAALRVAAMRDVEAKPERTPAERRADALVDLCRFYLDHRPHRARRHRGHLNVVIDAEALLGGGPGRFVDGSPCERSIVERLACDSNLHRVVMAGGSTVLDYGRAVRTVPTDLWNAVLLRDAHCRHPGCDRPSEWCEAHHVIPFPHGPTAIDNLVLLCSRHHHLIHRPDWHGKLRPDAEYEVTDAQGRVWVSRPGMYGMRVRAAPT